MRNSSRRRKRDPETRGDPNRWLLSYTDMTVLLLAFFVVLMGMAVKDRERVRKALGSVAGSIGISHRDVAFQTSGDGGNATIMNDLAHNDRLTDETIDPAAIEGIAAACDPRPEMAVLAEDGKVMIRMGQTVLFDESSGELNPGAREFLAALSDRLRRSRDDIEIGGHTDRYESIDNPYWPGNAWELSLKRALAVYNFLETHGIDAWRMSIHGFGATHPLSDSEEPPDSCSGNARVELGIGKSHLLPSQVRGPGRQVRKSAWYEEIDYKNFLFGLFSTGETKH